MSLLRAVKGWLGLDPDSVTRTDSVSADDPLFAYVMLPGNIQPAERSERFEEPLQEILERTRLGSITGGGSQLDDNDEDGRARVAFAGIDIDIYDAKLGLDLLATELRRLGAPSGTRVLYELDGKEHELRLDDR